MREEASASGGVRLGHKPLLDTLLHVALGVAAEQELQDFTGLSRKHGDGWGFARPWATSWR
ncbi:MAG: hypothetical protein JWO11_2443 [Nocardioides sp.]|nr:hypothetical protein [Nocardioides sp.]